MATKSISSKAQTSVEFLFVFIVMLIYVQTILIPAVDKGVHSAVDIQAMARTRMSAERLANSIMEVANTTGDSEKYIWIYLPDNQAQKNELGASINDVRNVPGYGKIWCNESPPRIDYNAYLYFTDNLPVSNKNCEPYFTGEPDLNTILICSGSIPVQLPPGITLNCGGIIGNAPEAVIGGPGGAKTKIRIRKDATTVMIGKGAT
jgi:uncharacterized protein (UPF0333 family)